MARHLIILIASAAAALLFCAPQHLWASEAVGLHGPAAPNTDTELSASSPLLSEGDSDVRVLRLLDQAVSLRAEGRVDEALVILRQGLEAHPGHPALLRQQARLLYLSGQAASAAAVYRALLRSRPDDSRLRYELGLCLEDLGSFEGAEAAFIEALRLETDYTGAIQALAELRRRTGKTAQAIRSYEDLLDADPSIQGTHRTLADLYLRGGRFDKALFHYRKAVSIDPKDRLAAGKLEQLEKGPAAGLVRQERERRRGERIASSVQVVPPPFAPARMPRIRVGIVEEAFTIEFKCAGPFILRDSQGRLLSMRPRPAGQGYVISPRGSSQLAVANAGEGLSSFDLVSEGVIIETVLPESAITLFNVRTGKGYFWSGEADRSYRGSIEVRRRGEGLLVVNSVSMEEYLYSVVPSEMPASWPAEALAAQAVAARTEATHKLGRHRGDGFDLCAEVHCQAYTGVERENARTTSAVDRTRGRVLLSGGAPIDAVYSSSCGGHTQDNVFGDGRPVSYLRGKGDFQEGLHGAFPLSPAALESWIKGTPASVYCAESGLTSSSHFRWTRTMTAAELTAALRPYASVGRVTGVEVLRRGVSGHAMRVRVTGTQGEAVIEKELLIRRALGNLRSALFVVEAKKAADGRTERFYFHGGGWGHGVGLCQTGAAGMAARGLDHTQILAHYFSGAEIAEGLTEDPAAEAPASS